MRCRVFNTPHARTSGTVPLSEFTKERGGKVLETWDAYATPDMNMCDAGPTTVSGPARGVLRKTPVIYHNVRDFRAQALQMYGYK